MISTTKTMRAKENHRKLIFWERLEKGKAREREQMERQQEEDHDYNVSSAEEKVTLKGCAR